MRNECSSQCIRDENLDAILADSLSLDVDLSSLQRSRLPQANQGLAEAFQGREKRLEAASEHQLLSNPRANHDHAACLPILTQHDASPIKLHAKFLSSIAQRSSAFSRGDIFIGKADVEQILSLHPSLKGMIDCVCLTSSRELQAQMLEEQYLEEGDSDNEDREARDDNDEQALKASKGPHSRCAYRELPALLLISWRAASLKRCESGYELLEKCPALLRLLGACWRGEQSADLGMKLESLRKLGMSGDHMAQTITPIIKRALRPAWRSPRGRRAALNRLGVIIEAISKRKLGLRVTGIDLKAESREKGFALAAIGVAKRLSAAAWVSERALNCFDKLPPVMRAKDERLSAAESDLLRRQCEHVVAAGLSKQDANKEIFRGEAEHWPNALSLLALLMTGMRPGELCRLRIGVNVTCLGRDGELSIRFPRLKRKGGRGAHASHTLGSSIEIALKSHLLTQALSHYSGVAAPFLIASEGGKTQALQIVKRIRKLPPSSRNMKKWQVSIARMETLQNILQALAEARMKKHLEQNYSKADQKERPKILKRSQSISRLWSPSLNPGDATRSCIFGKDLQGIACFTLFYWPMGEEWASQSAIKRLKDQCRRFAFLAAGAPWSRPHGARAILSRRLRGPKTGSSLDFALEAAAGGASQIVRLADCLGHSAQVNREHYDIAAPCSENLKLTGSADLLNARHLGGWMRASWVGEIKKHAGGGDAISVFTDLLCDPLGCIALRHPNLLLEEEGGGAEAAADAFTASPWLPHIFQACHDENWEAAMRIDNYHPMPGLFTHGGKSVSADGALGAIQNIESHRDKLIGDGDQWGGKALGKWGSLGCSLRMSKNGMSGINGKGGMKGVSGISGVKGINGISGMKGMNGMSGVNGKAQSALLAVTLLKVAKRGEWLAKLAVCEAKNGGINGDGSAAALVSSLKQSGKKLMEK